MSRRTTLTIALLLAALPSALAQDDVRKVDPLDIDKIEKATVRLVLLDVLVLDRNEGTVSGLTADDFTVHHNGRRVAIDTIDEYCDEGSRADPEATRLADKRNPVPPPANGRRIVFAIDYQHIGFAQRSEVFEHARKWMRDDMLDGDAVMIAALTGGVRIEQPFTTDRDTVLRSLQRMEHDVTLWNGRFAHENEIGWVTGVTSLLDVVGEEDGRKALVLYSTMGDVPLDLQFDQIAAHAASARCAIYPVDALGIGRIGGGLRFIDSTPGSRGGGGG